MPQEYSWSQQLTDCKNKLLEMDNMITSAARLHNIALPEFSKSGSLTRLLKLIDALASRDNSPQPDLATITYQSNTIQRLAAANGAMQLALEHALLAINTNTELGTEVGEIIRRALEIQKESRQNGA